MHGRLTNLGGCTFDITIVYHDLTLVKRCQLWNGMTEIRTWDHVDWITKGDFNMICFLLDRDELGTFVHVGAFEFNHAMEELIELGTIGWPNTWCNDYGLQHMKTKLDRVFVNQNWLIWRPYVRSTLLFRNCCDNVAIFIELLPIEKGSKPFKFYNSWLCQALFNNLFQTAWAIKIEGSP